MTFNKKAQYVELTVTLVFIIAFVLVAIFVYQAFSEVNDDIQADAEFSTESKATVADLENSMPSLFDGIGILILVGMWVVSLVVAYNSDGNPLMVIIALFIVVALGFVAMVLSNTWAEVYNDDETASFAVDFPIMNYVFENYLVVIVIMCFSVLLVGVYRGGGF